MCVSLGISAALPRSRKGRLSEPGILFALTEGARNAVQSTGGRPHTYNFAHRIRLIRAARIRRRRVVPCSPEAEPLRIHQQGFARAGAKPHPQYNESFFVNFLIMT